MSVRIIFAVLVLLICSGVSHAKDGRWNNFAEDADLKYFLDQKTIISLPDNVHIFWVKSVAKDKEYFKREYNQNNLSYVFTSYELDCAVSSYRVRGAIMFDRNRREISKSLPDKELAFEPVPPESMLELAQDEICGKEKGVTEVPKDEEPLEAEPEAPTTSEAPESPKAPAGADEAPSIQ